MRAPAVSLVVALAATAAPALSGETEPAPVVIADFENPADRAMVRTRKDSALSTEKASQGRTSLRLQAGDYINIQSTRLGLSRPGDLLRIDLFHSGDRPLSVRAELFDPISLKSYWHRHVRGYALRPGWNTLSFRVARLYRGEKNSQRIRDSFLDPGELSRIDLAFDDGPCDVYIDNIRFEPDPPMPDVPGLRAFDFGPANQAIRHGFTPCSRETYDEACGWGWSGPGWPGAVRDYIHPNDILADFREARGETFSVRVPDDTYRVRVYYEDHGWWEDQFAWFSRRTIDAEGKTVFDETLSHEQAARRFYQFADTEPLPDTDIYDTYIRSGRYKPKEFDVIVADGRLDLRFDADQPMVCRIAAIVFWPTSRADDATKWCAELDRRMRAEFDAENVYIDAAPHGRKLADLPEAARSGGLVVFSASGTAPISPSHIPDERELVSEIRLFCVPGEDTGASFGLRSVKESGLVAVRATLPGLEPALFLVQNRLVRHDGQYTITPDILRPAGETCLEPRTSRQFWLEISVPRSTPPGRYAGQVHIGFVGRTTTLPVSVEVLPIALSEPRMAFGLLGLLPDRYAPPDAAETVIGQLRRHGLSSVSGVPIGTAETRGRAVKVNFGRGDLVMSALKKAGFELPVDTYGGSGLSGIGEAAGKLGHPPSAVFRLAMAQLRDHARQADWLPLTYSMVDEPHWSDQAVIEAAREVEQVAAAAPWLVTNGYWSPRPDSPAHRRLMDALGRTMLGRVTLEAVEYLKSKGKQVGYYGGCSREEFGLRQWAADAEGFAAHYAWHAYVRYGAPYYDLDAREPDVCMFYYTPTEVRLSLRLKAVRAGAYDYRYLRTLADLTAKAGGEPVAEAKRLLDQAALAGNLYQKGDAPKIADINAFRRKVAEAIIALERYAPKND